MNELQRLEMCANKLHQEEPLPIISGPWHTHNTLHVHERAYDLRSLGCGKGLTDIAS